MWRKQPLKTWVQAFLSKRAASSLSAGYNPVLPPCSFQPKPYVGPSYEKAIQIRKEVTNPALLTAFAKPLIMNQGYMQYVWDQTGKRYLDFSAGIVTVSVGHSHPKLVKALADQNVKIWHAPSIFINPATIEYMEKLASTLPGNLKAIYLTNSGTEANDLALNMARLHTGRFDIISLQNAYHGGSPHLAGATAISSWKHNVASGFGSHQTIVPDVYRGPWGGSKCRDSPVQTTRQCNCPAGQCEANERYLEQLSNTLIFTIPKTGPAAFIAESIQGAGGAVQFPKDYIKKAFEMIRSKGGLCISDEVQTGFARTGTHMWGFEGHGVVPDIVCMAKGIGNGFPLAAVITTHEIAQSLASATHFNTYGGDPLACAVGSAVLDVIKEENIMSHADEIGTYLLKELEKLRDECAYVGDVRGKGLMVGLELVADKDTRKPLEAEKMNAVWNSAREKGLILLKGGVYLNVFRLKPPMCIGKDDVDFAVGVLRQCLDEI